MRYDRGSVDVLQVIAEPRRREILRLVWDTELAAGDIAKRFDISFPAVSQHLRALREAGLVQVRKEGTHRYYRAHQEALAAFRGALQQMWSADLAALAAAAQEEHDAR